VLRNVEYKQQKQNAKRMKQIKSDVNIDPDQMDLSSWRNPTEEERIASLDSDEQCDKVISNVMYMLIWNNYVIIY
jgi:hypothetical protein